MTAPSDGARPRNVALVLGGGGVTGFAFHAGSLAALEAVARWDARTADLVVGTSAGAGVAALLRAGVGPADLLAHETGGRLSPRGSELLAASGDEPWDGGDLHAEAGRAPGWPHLAARGVLRWPPKPGVTLAGLAPRGRKDTRPLGNRYRRLLGRWPDRALWLTAVRVDDGRRATFGRDDLPPVDVGTAVEASAAIPGYFRPVEVGGASYIDGGAWSSTNADLLVGLHFDVVVIIAPLSARRSALRAHRSGAARVFNRTVLHREAGRVRRSGSEVIVIEPGPADVDALGPNAMDESRRGRAAEQAHQTLAARLASNRRLADLLSPVVAR